MSLQPLRRAMSRLASLTAATASQTGERLLEACGVPAPNVLLLLGHMRSGSTLLFHLLLTHAQFGGLGERNVPYTSGADFARLALAARLAGPAPLRRLRYVVDQLNHNRFSPNPALLQSPRLRLVFLLREPQATLASLLELSRVYYGGSWTIADAVEYYVARLQGMMDLAARLASPQRAAWLEYEGLTAAPEKVLEALRLFLGLSVGFSAHYAPQPFTGRRGDPGSKITAGRVLPEVQSAAIELNSEQRARLHAVYSRCRIAFASLALPLHQHALRPTLPSGP